MSPRAVSLEVEVGAVRLRNPVLLASGTCGYGEELAPWVSWRDLGGFVAKSVTREPREGNPMPRVAECAAGMLNAIGLANVGLDAFCRDKLPVMRSLPCAVMANVAGSSAEEYADVVSRLDREPGLAALEINVSCPNVRAGGLEFGRDPAVLHGLVRSLRPLTRLPLWVKLSPNVTDITVLARAAAEAGADALTVMNTLVGMRIDTRTRRPVLANGRGGLSGPAVKPVALHLVYQTAGAVDIPVIGAGGIETAEDALEFLLAGARAVQVGTATFRRPDAAHAIVRGLADYLRVRGLERITDVIGEARP